MGKVVSTISGGRHVLYQLSHTKRLSKVKEDVVPQAQFHYDFEPFSIQVKKDKKEWYDFLTSLLALLGGAFVMMRLLTNVSLSALTSFKHLFPKPSSGRGGGL